MEHATRNEAISIALLLDVDTETVWEIIKGMEYSTYSELAMAVHREFLHPAKPSKEHHGARGRERS